MNIEVARTAARVLVESQWPEGEVARQLSCREANEVASFIRDVLSKEDADVFLQAHSLSDEKGEEHYDIGLLTKERGIGWTP